VIRADLGQGLGPASVSRPTRHIPVGTDTWGLAITNDGERDETL
jgi:hypothetical protein